MARTTWPHFGGKPVPMYRVQSRRRGRKQWQTHQPGSVALGRVRSDVIRWAIEHPDREYRIVKAYPDGRQDVEATADERGELHGGIYG